MSLTRTSVISTARLLTTNSDPTGNFARPPPPHDRLARNRRAIRRAWPAWRHSPKYAVPLPLMPCPRQSSAANASPQPGDPRRQLLGGRLQPVEQQPARLLAHLPRRKASTSGADRSRLLGRPAHAVDGGGRQPFRRPHDHEVQQPSPATGSTRSPRPRQTAGPPARKNGTSLPNSAARRASSSASPGPGSSRDWRPPGRPPHRWSRRPDRPPSGSASPAAACAPRPSPSAGGATPPPAARDCPGPRGTSSNPPLSGPPAADPHWHSNSSRPLGVLSEIQGVV